MGKKSLHAYATTSIELNKDFFPILAVTKDLIKGFKKYNQPKAKKIDVMIVNFFQIPEETHMEFHHKSNIK